MRGHRTEKLLIWNMPLLLAKSGIFLPEFHVPDFSPFFTEERDESAARRYFFIPQRFVSALLLGWRKSIPHWDVRGKLQGRVEWYTDCSIRVQLWHLVTNLKSERL